MSAFTAGFDPIEYSKQLRNAGVSQEQADVQAQTMEHVFNNMLQQAKQESKELFNNKDLATRGDIEKVKSDLEKVKLELQKEIALIESSLIKWVVGVGISATIVLCGAMFTMLKLMIH